MYAIYMVASLKLITSARVTKKGYPIVVELFNSSKQRPKDTIGHSFIEHWNENEQLPLQSHSNYNELLPKIKDYHAIISRINYRGYGFTRAYQLLFENIDIDNLKPKGLLEFFDEFIAEKQAANIQCRHFLDLKSVIYSYLDGVDVPIADINYEWLMAFKIHKLNNGRCNEGGVISYFRNLRTVYNEAKKRKSIKLEEGNPFAGLIKNVKSKDVIEFPPDKFKLLLLYSPRRFTAKANHRLMQRKIAIIAFQFYIGGHDYADIALLKWSDIKVGRRIVFKRYKNRSRFNGGVQINNYLCNEAVEIIENYGDKTTERIFSFIPNPKTDYKRYISNRSNFSRFLEKVSVDVDSEKLSSKSMRFIFRTYAGNLLIHDLIVMRLQGHKPKGITYTYQGAVSLEVQDREHQRIIDIVRSKGL